MGIVGTFTLLLSIIVCQQQPNTEIKVQSERFDGFTTYDQCDKMKTKLEDNYDSALLEDTTDYVAQLNGNKPQPDEDKFRLVRAVGTCVEIK